MKKKINNFPQIKVFNLKKFTDNRGIFYEIYKSKRYKQIQINDKFVQNSISISKKNVLRGFHYTINNSQSQLLTILEGKIFDCIVDLRKKSKTFKKVFTFILSSKKNNQIYMPSGMAHGFCVLSNTAILHYSTNQEYNPANECGLLWSDKTLNIKWPIKKPIISKRDKTFSSLKDIIKKKKLPE